MIRHNHQGATGHYDNLDSGPAAMLVDGERRIIDNSEGAAAILEDGDAISASFGRLVASSQADMVHLEQAIHAARWNGAATGKLALGSVEIDVLRMGADRRRPQFLILARRTDAEKGGLIAERAAKRFGLTAAERRLLAQLLEGLELKDAAAHLGVARTTARTHLQHIFDKTGVRRQSELQRLIAAECRRVPIAGDVRC